MWDLLLLPWLRMEMNLHRSPNLNIFARTFNTQEILPACRTNTGANLLQIQTWWYSRYRNLHHPPSYVRWEEGDFLGSTSGRRVLVLLLIGLIKEPLLYRTVSSFEAFSSI